MLSHLLTPVLLLASAMVHHDIPKAYTGKDPISDVLVGDSEVLGSAHRHIRNLESLSEADSVRLHAGLDTLVQAATERASLTSRRRLELAFDLCAAHDVHHAFPIALGAAKNLDLGILERMAAARCLASLASSGSPDSQNTAAIFLQEQLGLVVDGTRSDAENCVQALLQGATNKHQGPFKSSALAAAKKCDGLIRSTIRPFAQRLLNYQKLWLEYSQLTTLESRVEFLAKRAGSVWLNEPLDPNTPRGAKMTDG